MLLKSKVVIFIISISLILCFYTQVVFATLDNGGYYKYPVDLDYSSLPSGGYYGHMYNAVDDWNNSTGKTLVKYVGNSPNKAICYYSSTDGWWGYRNRISVTGQPGYHQTTKFEIGLNTYRLNGTVNPQESTSCHELGHNLGLTDLNSGTSIMNVNRDRTIIYKPQSGDISDAKTNYAR